MIWPFGKSNEQEAHEKVLEAKTFPLRDLIPSDLKEADKMAGYTVYRCPFHEEKTGSFLVNNKKNCFVCLGCGAAGNSISFVMKYEKCFFVEAVQSLLNKLEEKNND